MSDDLIRRQAVVDMTGLSEWFDSSDSYNEFVIALSELPPVKPEQCLTDDDKETIRIHLGAIKEELCNQRRVNEAKEYEGIIDRLMRSPSFKSVPCEDAISRQAAIKAICRHCTPEKPERCLTAEICHSYQELKALPPVKPAEKQKPCEDCINREETLKALMDEWTEFDSEIIDSLVEKIKKLPPVTPAEKVGQWRHYENMLTCSECGAEYYDEIMYYCGDDVPKYCPLCGCKMTASPTGTERTDE